MYPSPFYRVVAKAFITNQAGHVLVVRESDEFWSLPGGGLEHGETAATCLKREIKEELGISDIHVDKIVHSATIHLDKRNIWMSWNVYAATIENHDFTFGDGVTDAKYIDIAELSDSEHILEQLLVETYRAIQR
ncbi:hypothetical protein CL689_03370 [Candidatus Saccharibacteria bacterium]|nr:hypothetical protein [Candidatus Saccharibacteria bacterium]MBQ69081.1 hypothetical protein [Candidatus Saccharibacteria bacterium]|tara:strand:+ start:248 stop:649 length:402 start_codon:yes stop_codon:yes gene_type:complete